MLAESITQTLKAYKIPNGATTCFTFLHDGLGLTGIVRRWAGRVIGWRRGWSTTALDCRGAGRYNEMIKNITTYKGG